MFRCLLTVSLAALCVAGMARAEPRSAIPWLSDSLHARRESMAVPSPVPGVPGSGAPAVPGAGAVSSLAPGPTAPDAAILVTPLGPPSQDGAGLLSSRTTGLPADLWGPTSVLRASALIEGLAGTGVPAAQDLFRTLLLATAAPPRGAGPEAVLLRSRIDRLMEMGALEEALELVTQANVTTPEFLLRRFDISLLTGQEEKACKLLLGRSDIKPTAAARIFCLARSDAWTDAVVSLAVARQAGDVSEAENALFSRFLDMEETRPGERIAVPDQVSPLNYLMLIAIGAGGAAVAETDLPVAFATLDLAPTAPPRARILAAEKLVASGGLSYPILFYAYRAETPAASGGVWSRSAAVQDLDAAIAAADGAALDAALPKADKLLTDMGLRVAFAREYAPLLAGLAPGLITDRLRVCELLLLGGETTAARRWIPRSAPLPLRTALAVADGDAPPDTPDPGSLEAAVLRAFAPEAPEQPPYERLAAQLAEGRTGEALLQALSTLDARRGIDPSDLTAALRVIHDAGQDDAARDIAVELLLMNEGM
ncbi:hypothetical protein FDP22_14645 [Paroceanicella profunda]|uniref:Uncharacterized protein n=1 Tax=Paroceanicella profunda TaxID=2579971 RepID=A0A5B8FZ16_9RHOB|nr:hypothetical protein [Paroceanicella profunda]QDL92914.1 hypothetical protein FDP22_14645 [Paroceanicella profunda]